MHVRRVAFVVLAVLPGVAHAQTGSGVTAQAQFDYGLAEMEAGRYESGCPALAESYRIDPHPGVLFTLAECENRWGKLASALTHYGAYLDLFDHMSAEQKALQRGRDRVSIGQRDHLRRDVPELAIRLPPDAPMGTIVTRDGAALGDPSLGVALPVDPGEHIVVARTPDGAQHDLKLVLARGEHRALTLDLTPVAAVPAAARVRTGASPRPVRDRGLSPAMRAAVWIGVGLGVVGLGVGTIAGAMVLVDKATVDAHCRPDDTCDALGLRAANHARPLGTASEVGFAAGAVGATAAILLLVVSPGQSTSAAARRWQLAGDIKESGGIVGMRTSW